MRQTNPTLHRDAVNDINQVRNQNDLNPSAPPLTDLHDVILM